MLGRRLLSASGLWGPLRGGRRAAAAGAAALAAGATAATAAEWPLRCEGAHQAPRTPLPPRPERHVLRPEADPRVDASVLIRFEPPEHLRTGAAVVVLPGGNYEECCMGKEGHQVAVWLTGLGITTFVLRYRLLPEGHYWPAQLEDLELALRMVREHATAWRVDRRRVGVMGFSAGGHLAGAAATSADPSIRPDAQILVYPCVDTTKPAWWPWTTAEGFPPPEDSVHLRATADAPPAFLAVSTEDGLCTAEDNTEPYAAKLRALGVPVEHYVSPMGKHGHGVKGGWTTACEAWLGRLGWLSPAKGGQI